MLLNEIIIEVGYKARKVTAIDRAKYLSFEKDLRKYLTKKQSELNNESDATFKLVTHNLNTTEKING